MAIAHTSALRRAARVRQLLAGIAGRIPLLEE